MRKLPCTPNTDWPKSPLTMAVAKVFSCAGQESQFASKRNKGARALTTGLLMGMALGVGMAHAADTVTGQGATTPPRQGSTAPQVPGADASAPAAAAPEKAADSGSSASKLDTVTITAEKRLSRAIDVPQSVAAISGKQLLEQGKTTLNDYLSGTPGVNVSPSGSTKNNITVRGVTTGGVGNPTVSVLIDDVPAHAATSTAEGGSLAPTLDPVDMRDIEVLRGPQSTLYGASSMGGLVKYSTVDPDSSKLGGMIQLDGNYVDHGGAGYAERAAVNIPLKNDLGAVRLSAYDRRDPGYYTNVADGSTHEGDVRNQGQRLAAIFYPTDSVTIRSQVIHQKTDQSGLRGEYYSADGNSTYGDNTNSRIPAVDKQNRELTFLTNTISADLNWATFNSTTGYSDGRYGFIFDMSPSFAAIANMVGLTGDGAVLTQGNSTHKFSQEFRLESPEDGRKLEWRAGLFYTQEKSDVNQVITFADQTTGALVPDGDLENINERSAYREAALFGSTRYHFTDKFDVELGLRYARNHQSFYEVEAGADDVAGSSHEGVTSYSFAPRYHLSKDWMVYGRIANGYRPGGANIGVSAGLPQSYGSDKSVNYELGTKAEFLNGRLATELSVYHITWKNIQLQAVDTSSGIGYYVNSGGAKSDGVETSVSARPWAGMTVTGALGLSRAVLTQDAPDSIYGVAGDALPESAKWNGSLTMRQTYPMFNGVQGFTGGTLTYVGKRTQDFTPDSATPRLKLPGYATIDLQTGGSKDGWTVVAYVRNLMNTRAYTAASYMDQVNYSAVYDRVLVNPRTIGLSLSKSF